MSATGCLHIFQKKTLHLYNAVDVSRTFPEWPLFEKLTFLRTPDREWVRRQYYLASQRVCWLDMCFGKRAGVDDISDWMLFPLWGRDFLNFKSNNTTIKQILQFNNTTNPGLRPPRHLVEDRVWGSAHWWIQGWVHHILAHWELCTDIRQVFVWNPQDCFFFRFLTLLGKQFPNGWRLKFALITFLRLALATKRHNWSRQPFGLCDMCSLVVFIYWHWSVVKANAMSWDVAFYLKSSMAHFHFSCIASHTIKYYFVQFLLISNNLYLSSLWGKSPRTFRGI